MEPSNPPELSRRDFLKLTKETAKGLTVAALMTSIRSSFAPSHSPTPADVSPAIKPPEKGVVYEKEVKDRLVESMLKRMVVLDTGKPGTGEPLSEYDVWRVITGNLTATQEEFEERQSLTSSLELTHRERVAQHYMYQRSHGQNVMNSLREGLATVADYHQDGPINFMAKATPEQADQLFAVSELEEKWYSDSGKTRGPKMVFDSPPPTANIEPGENVSASFQFGKHVISYAEEALTIENTILAHEDVRTFLKKQVDYEANYNATDAPKGEFILPLGKTTADIVSITVTKIQNGEVVEETTIPITFSDERDSSTSGTKIISNTVPVEHYTIQLNSGETIEINPEPSKDDYTETWTRLEAYTDRPPEEIFGAFHRDNPFRAENIQLLKEFMKNNPDTFWIWAIGNHGDVLTEEDMADMPENCIHVGQIIPEMYQDKKYYAKTFGGTLGNSQTIYVALPELGIEGDGSSLATPQISAAAGLYSIETQGKPIKRQEFIKYLLDNGALKQIEYTVPYYDGQTQAEIVTMNILDVDGYSNLINSTAQAITSEVKTTSRRDFLRGKVRP